MSCHAERRRGRPSRPGEGSPGATGRSGCALSTGQAARHCLVSGATIANWIAAGRLPAQRTVGGQYRIRPSDLRAFMLAHGMSTELLDAELGGAPFCWQYWAATLQPRPAGGVCTSCIDCPVRRSGAADCFEVRPLLSGGTLRALSCADCDYLAARQDHTIQAR